jgi:hypothetical protein
LSPSDTTSWYFSLCFFRRYRLENPFVVKEKHEECKQRNCR